MNRTARLIQASSQVRRRIWASMPFSARYAQFFTRLAASSIDAFGLVIYEEFLRKGVEGMPDVGSKDPSEFQGKKNIRLPSGYGRDFGKKAYLMLMAKYKSPSLVEDILSEFTVEFLSGWSSKYLKGDVSLKEAQNYVLKSLNSRALNALRKHHREIADSYFSGGEEKSHHDTAISVDEDTMERQILRQLPKMKSKLKAIHPDAPKYVQLSLVEGYGDREIIGNPAAGQESLLDHPVTNKGTPMTVQLWSTSYKPKIMDVLKKNFDYLRL